MNNSTDKNIRPIIFVHIPKTAGTSFRSAANEYYGNDKILNDYGYESEETSEAVLKHYYQNEDANLLRDASKSFQLISGHYPASRYSEIFEDAPVVAFIREPIARVVSEYNHFCNLNGYTGSFRSFYSDEVYQNRQHKLLTGLSLKELAFVGITDEYDLSLSIFNDLFEANLQSQSINKGHYQNNSLEDLSKEEVDEITDLNQKDIALYQAAKEMLLSYRDDKVKSGHQ